MKQTQRDIRQHRKSRYHDREPKRHLSHPWPLRMMLIVSRCVFYDMFLHVKLRRCKWDELISLVSQNTRKEIQKVKLWRRPWFRSPRTAMPTCGNTNSIGRRTTRTTPIQRENLHGTCMTITCSLVARMRLTVLLRRNRHNNGENTFFSLLHLFIRPVVIVERPGTTLHTLQRATFWTRLCDGCCRGYEWRRLR